MDLLNWIGSSASYDSYGLCTSIASSSVYFGTSASDRLKTDWGDIPGVIANCGSGWYTLTADEWSYILFTRSTGKTINSTPDARYTLATIRTDVSAVKGMILFPDDYSGETPTGVTWGDINTYSNWATSCTASGWDSLQTAGCVFLPISGYLWDKSINQFTGSGFYWSSTSIEAGKAREMYFKSNKVTCGNDGRPCGFCVRLVRNIG